MGIERITLKSYALIDKCILAADVPLPLFSTPPLLALGATFLGWFLLRPDDAIFNWDILILSEEDKEELRAAVELMVGIVRKNEDVTDYERFLPPYLTCITNLPRSDVEMSSPSPKRR